MRRTAANATSVDGHRQDAATPSQTSAQAFLGAGSETEGYYPFPAGWYDEAQVAYDRQFAGIDAEVVA